MLDKVDEAPLREAEGGLVPEGEGWFVVNVADAQGLHTERFGDGCRFEGAERFDELGFNVRVLKPGQPASMYHREGSQEAFLVIAGECLAIVEDAERPMRAGDFLHLPPGTAHVIVGAGEGPSVVVMAGARKPTTEILFPASEVAARYGAAVEADTSDFATAYAGTSPPAPASLGLPW